MFSRPLIRHPGSSRSPVSVAIADSPDPTACTSISFGIAHAQTAKSHTRDVLEVQQGLIPPQLNVCTESTAARKSKQNRKISSGYRKSQDSAPTRQNSTALCFGTRGVQTKPSETGNEIVESSHSQSFREPLGDKDARRDTRCGHRDPRLGGCGSTPMSRCTPSLKSTRRFRTVDGTPQRA